MGRNGKCTLCAGLTDALVSRYGEPKYYPASAVWELPPKSKYKPQVHVMCDGAACSVYAAGMDGGEPSPLGRVSVDADIARVIGAINQIFG